MAWSNIGGGGGENVSAEVAVQTPLIQQIREAIVGKATLANATADKIVKGFSAYVGQELVNGTLEPLSMQDVAEMFGFSKISVDHFSPSSKTRLDSMQINFSLDETPEFILIYSEDGSSEGQELISYVIIGYTKSSSKAGQLLYTNASSVISRTQPNISVSGQQITISYTGAYFINGKNYSVITMA